MIHSLLEMEFNKAVSDTDNKNEDGSINWNFVDSDCYMSGVPKLYKDDTEYYADWNDLADKFDECLKINKSFRKKKKACARLRVYVEIHLNIHHYSKSNVLPDCCFGLGGVEL